MRHVDLMVPSQHLLEGRRYAAEYQIWHLHLKRQKAPVVSIFVDLHPDDVMNGHLQLALDQWQRVWENDMFECRNGRRGRRGRRPPFRRGSGPGPQGAGDRMRRTAAATAAAAARGSTSPPRRPRE